MSTWKPHRPEVVVGVDASPCCRGAVEAAVREAQLREADLVAVMAVGSGPHRPDAPAGTGTVEAAEHRLRAFLRSVGTGGLDVDLVVTTAPPADALVQRSHGAELLVLGGRAGRVPQDLSVRAGCLAGARCPVLVVGSDPDRTDDEPERDDVTRLI